MNYYISPGFYRETKVLGSRRSYQIWRGNRRGPLPGMPPDANLSRLSIKHAGAMVEIMHLESSNNFLEDQHGG